MYVKPSWLDELTTTIAISFLGQFGLSAELSVPHKVQRDLGPGWIHSDRGSEQEMT